MCVFSEPNKKLRFLTLSTCIKRQKKKHEVYSSYLTSNQFECEIGKAETNERGTSAQRSRTIEFLMSDVYGLRAWGVFYRMQYIDTPPFLVWEFRADLAMVTIQSYFDVTIWWTPPSRCLRPRMGRNPFPRSESNDYICFFFVWKFYFIIHRYANSPTPESSDDGRIW